MTEAERWVDIPGFEGRYEVSDQGRVRSWAGWRGRVREEPYYLSLNPNKHTGYIIVALSGADGEKTSRSVHSLVCEAFVGPRPDGQEVRHLNGDRADSRLSNLTYGTPKENAADKVAHGTQPYGERTGTSTLTYYQARAIQLLWDSGEYSYRLISEVLDVNQTTVRNVATRRNWGETPSECVTG